jgi:hypothetical protein
MKKKKGNVVYVKPVVNHDVLQINILQEKKEEKNPTPDKIFEGYKAELKSKPKKKKKK